MTERQAELCILLNKTLQEYFELTIEELNIECNLSKDESGEYTSSATQNIWLGFKIGWLEKGRK